MTLRNLKLTAWWVQRVAFVLVGFFWLVDAWNVAFNGHNLSLIEQVAGAALAGLYLLVNPLIQKPK